MVVWGEESDPLGGGTVCCFVACCLFGGAPACVDVVLCGMAFDFSPSDGSESFCNDALQHQQIEVAMFLQLPRPPQGAGAVFPLQSADTFWVKVCAGGYLMCEVNKLIKIVEAGLIVDSHAYGPIVAEADYGP